MPNYNHASYLPEALDAIVAQSYAASEIIIVDDASTDNSVDVVKRYMEHYPQIKLYHNESNLGPIKTINRCIALSQGDFLVFCAADDIVLPRFFEKMVAMMCKFPDIGLCTSLPRYFKNGSYQDDSFPELAKEPVIYTPQQLVHIVKKTSFYIPTHASIYRREAVIQQGGLVEGLLMFADHYLSYLIAFSQNIGFIPEVLASMRVHNRSYSATVNRNVGLFPAWKEQLLKTEPLLRRRLASSALFTVYGRQILSFLLKNPSLWAFLFPIVQRKGCNRLKVLKKMFIK